MFTSFNARAIGLKLTVDETLRLASTCGFGGVDVMIRDAIEENVDLRAMKQRLDDLGLQPGAFPFPFDWRAGDESQFASELERLNTYAEAAATLGLPRTATWVMPASDRDDTYRFHSSRLVRIAAILGKFGIRLGLEVIGVESSRTGRGLPFIHRLDQLEPLRREIADGCAQPIGVLIDSWHLYAADEPLAHTLAWGVEAIVWVHLADLPAESSPDRSRMIDSIRGLPGERGAIENGLLLSALSNLGYAGPVTAEPLSCCKSLQGRNPDEIAARVAESLRLVWPDQSRALRRD